MPVLHSDRPFRFILGDDARKLPCRAGANRISAEDAEAVQANQVGAAMLKSGAISLHDDPPEAPSAEQRAAVMASLADEAPKVEPKQADPPMFDSPGSRRHKKRGG